MNSFVRPLVQNLASQFGHVATSGASNSSQHGMRATGDLRAEVDQVGGHSGGPCLRQQRRPTAAIARLAYRDNIKRPAVVAVVVADRPVAAINARDSAAFEVLQLSYLHRTKHRQRAAVHGLLPCAFVVPARIAVQAPSASAWEDVFAVVTTPFGRHLGGLSRLFAKHIGAKGKQAHCGIRARRLRPS